MSAEVCADLRVLRSLLGTMGPFGLRVRLGLGYPTQAAQDLAREREATIGLSQTAFVSRCLWVT
jgi:hypothetical protein